MTIPMESGLDTGWKQQSKVHFNYVPSGTRNGSGKANAAERGHILVMGANTW